MDTQRACRECGTPLPRDAPKGLCPRCLVAAGLGNQSGPGAGDTDAPDTEGGRRGWTTPRPEAIAEQFPQLDGIELLGRGGMGIVYRARQTELDRVVALKLLPPAPAHDPAFAERFAREAKALAKLNHPNIVTIHDSGRSEGGLYYFLMEFVDGPDLRRVIESRELTPQQALAIVPQICDALQYAHDQGVVHRDIKPENVLLDREGRVKIADFGLAKLLGRSAEDTGLTRSRQVMGTPRYMAPEQAQDPHNVDHRADIYSLGVVFYEMLTGQPPMGHFPPPSQKVHVDVRLDEVVLKALEMEPGRRYQHVSEVKTDVEALSLQPVPAASGPDAAAATGSAETGKRRVHVGCLAAILIAAVLLGGLTILTVMLTLPAYVSARHVAYVTEDAAGLKRIGRALHKHGAEHEGNFPDDLGQLFDAGYLVDGEAYICPRSKTAAPGGGDEVRSGRCDYLYFGKGKTLQTCGQNDPLAMTKPNRLGGRSVNVLYGDGHVQKHSSPPAGVLDSSPPPAGARKLGESFRTGAPKPEH